MYKLFTQIINPLNINSHWQRDNWNFCHVQRTKYDKTDTHNNLTVKCRKACTIEWQQNIEWEEKCNQLLTLRTSNMTENTIRLREILLQDRDLLFILVMTWASSLEMYWSLFSKSSPCNLNIPFQIRNKKPLFFFFPLPEGLVPPVVSFISPSPTALSSSAIPCKLIIIPRFKFAPTNSATNRLKIFREFIHAVIDDDDFEELDQRRKKVNWRNIPDCWFSGTIRSRKCVWRLD